jgi:hypothetical protein
MLDLNARLFGVQSTKITNPDLLAESMADAGNFYKDISKSSLQKKRIQKISLSEGGLSDSESETPYPSDFEFEKQSILKALTSKLSL